MAIALRFRLRPTPTLHARVVSVLALLFVTPPAAFGQSLEQTLEARRKALPKPKTAYGETFLAAPASGAATEGDLKLAAKVSVFQEAPRERLEVHLVNGSAFGEPIVVVGDGSGYFLVTKLGATPLAKSAKASDPLLLQALASMPDESARKRTLKAPDGKLAGVVYREPRGADFGSSTAFDVKASKVGGGLLKKNLAAFGDSDDTVVTASAGARGVDEIDTPKGKLSVTPDPGAVVWLESRQVGPLELEAFLLAGGLGPYAATEER